MTRSIGPVPEEALARGLGASDGEEVAFFLRQLRLRALGTLSGQVAATATAAPGTPAPSPGPAGPTGPPGPPAVYVPDLTPPPTPSGVVVSAGIDFIFFTTDAPAFSVGHGYSRTLVYGAQYGGSGPLPTFGSAVLRHEFVGQVGSFEAEPGSQWHLWFKWRSVDGILSTSPAGGTNGFQATASKIGNVNLGPLIVEAANLANGSVTASKVAAQAIGLTAFANGIEPVGVVSQLPDPAGYTGPKTLFRTTDGKLYRYVAGAWTRAVDGGDIIANSIVAGSIAAGAVGAAQIAAGAITTGKLLVTGQGRAINDDPTPMDTSAWELGPLITLATGTTASGATGNRYFASTSGINSFATSRRFAIDPAKQYRLTANLYAGIGNNRNMYVFVRMWNGAGTELTNADTGWGGTLAGYVYGGTPPTGVFTRLGDSFGAGTPRPIPSSVREIAVGVWFQYSEIGSSEVLQAAQDIRCEEYVGADLIVDGAIIASKIAANAIAVGTAAIQNGAIVNAMIADATISNAKIVSLAATKITAGTIAVGEYIQSSDYVNGSSGWRIGGNMAEFGFANVRGTISAGQISASLITADKLSISTLSAISANLGTVTAGVINGLTITGGTVTGTVVQTASSGQRVVLNESSSNEARFYGNRGDGTIELLASIGIRSTGSDFAIGYFGTLNSSRTSLYATAGGSSPAVEVYAGGTGRGIEAISTAASTAALYGQSFSASGVAVEGLVQGAGTALYGRVLGGSGTAVYGLVSNDPPVAGSGIGVHGSSQSGPGVKGDSVSGYGGEFTGNATRGPIRLTPFANAAALPSNMTDGQIAFYVVLGAARPVFSDGSNWRRFSDNSVVV